MSIIKLLILFLLFFFGFSQFRCNNSELNNLRNFGCASSKSPHNSIRGALLGTRFKSLEELKSVIQIEYSTNSFSSDSSANQENKAVRVGHCCGSYGVISELKSGVSQGDITIAKKGDFWDQLQLLIKSPYVISKRIELSKVFLLARRRSDLFGEGDPAFYDLAELAVKNINTPDLAFINVRDSTEKGFLNSFNHITAQAFITSCFSERLADFVGDSHERYYHPELLTGNFSEKQVKDLNEGPVDNYVDIINNEWGQELGKALKEKYKIRESTDWTPELLANYLNDLQSYFSWAFQIGFRPINQEDEIVIRFSNKLNSVLSNAITFEKI